MKKEKTVRTYQRRTKTGKLVTVKQHTAKYDAAEMLKEAAKKKGAGEELEKLKKKAQVKPTVEPEVKDDTLGFTSDEFKQWYHWDMENDPKNKAAKKVERALKERMGAKGYKQYFNEMTDGYSARGHNKAFKEISLNTDDPRETAAKMAKYESKKVTSEKETNSKSKAPKGKGFDNEKSFSQNFPKELRQYIDSRNFSLKKKPTKSVERAFNDAGFEIHHNDVEGIWEPTRNGMRYKETDWSAKNKAERAEKSDVVKWAKANGYSLRKDGMFQLKADSKKSRHEIYTLKDLEAKMGADKKSSPSTNTKSVAPTKTKTDKLIEDAKVQLAAYKGSKKDPAYQRLELMTRGFFPDEKRAILRHDDGRIAYLPKKGGNYLIENPNSKSKSRSKESPAAHRREQIKKQNEGIQKEISKYSSMKYGNRMYYYTNDGIRYWDKRSGTLRPISPDISKKLAVEFITKEVPLPTKVKQFLLKSHGEPVPSYLGPYEEKVREAKRRLLSKKR